jgi:hypothetical protein
VEAQTDGLFKVSDFVPVPCCFPTCNSVTYAFVEGDIVTPLTRLLNVEDYLDYLTNRALPELDIEIKQALEGLWSSSAVPGGEKAAAEFALSCESCGLAGLDLGAIGQKMFMVMLQDFMDPWTFNQKNLMKCCKEFLLPDGHQIPFCAYNTVGYREQARAQLTARQHGRHQAKREKREFIPEPITFKFDVPGGNGNSHKPATELPMAANGRKGQA